MSTETNRATEIAKEKRITYRILCCGLLASDIRIPESTNCFSQNRTHTPFGLESSISTKSRRLSENARCSQHFERTRKASTVKHEEPIFLMMTND